MWGISGTAGRNGRQRGSPNGSACDFADEELGKAAPYGIYDLTANAGWVNVGTDHDTGAFAVASIPRTACATCPGVCLAPPEVPDAS